MEAIAKVFGTVFIVATWFTAAQLGWMLHEEQERSSNSKRVTVMYVASVALALLAVILLIGFA